MNVTGTDFVLFNSTDLAASEAFYTETLGLELGPRWGDMGFEVETGDATLALIDVAKIGRAFTPSGTIVLRVDDVAAAKAELEGKGVEFQTDVIDSGVCHQAYFADPHGNTLGIHHRYAPREDA